MQLELPFGANLGDLCLECGRTNADSRYTIRFRGGRLLVPVCTSCGKRKLLKQTIIFTVACAGSLVALDALPFPENPSTRTVTSLLVVGSWLALVTWVGRFLRRGLHRWISAIWPLRSNGESAWVGVRSSAVAERLQNASSGGEPPTQRKPDWWDEIVATAVGLAILLLPPAVMVFQFFHVQQTGSTRLPVLLIPIFRLLGPWFFLLIAGLWLVFGIGLLQLRRKPE